jgi:hypothetical protein
MVLLGLPWFEWVGYSASFVVLLSFLMKDMQKLRIVNIAGCSLFIAYGLSLPSISVPIILTNTAIVVVNLYYLMKKPVEIV